jgi:hypothetical protein
MEGRWRGAGAARPHLPLPPTWDSTGRSTSPGGPRPGGLPNETACGDDKLSSNTHQAGRTTRLADSATTTLRRARPAVTGRPSGGAYAMPARKPPLSPRRRPARPMPREASGACKSSPRGPLGRGLPVFEPVLTCALLVRHPTWPSPRVPHVPPSIPHTHTNARNGTRPRQYDVTPPGLHSAARSPAPRSPLLSPPPRLLEPFWAFSPRGVLVEIPNVYFYPPICR